MQDRKPLAQLLAQLKADGNNIRAAEIEYNAIQLLLESFYWNLEDMKRIFNTAQTRGLNVTLGG